MVRRLALLLALAALAGPVTAAAKTPLPGFRSPSRNIRCLFVPGGPSSTLLCQVAHASYSQKLQDRCMAGPSVDWHGFELGQVRRGSITCSGGILYNPDTQVPRYLTLAYGHVWRYGVFTCRARVTGVTCRNRAGHGLFVSRESWRVW